jgi:hypothetical protein
MLWSDTDGWFGVWSFVFQVTCGPFIELGNFLSEDLWNEREQPYKETHRKLCEELKRPQKNIKASEFKRACCGSFAAFPAGNFFSFFFLTLTFVL